MDFSLPTKPKTKLPSQAFWAKAFHWINIISLILMITSGLQIYNVNPVFGGREGWHFPKFLVLGWWLGGGRDWHFAAMWIYALNLLGSCFLKTRVNVLRFEPDKPFKQVHNSA